MESDFEIADQQSIVFVTVFKLLSYLADIATDTAAGITYCKVNDCKLPVLWNRDSDEVKFPGTRSNAAISFLFNVNDTSNNHFINKAPVYGFVTLGLLWLPGMPTFISQQFFFPIITRSHLSKCPNDLDQNGTQEDNQLFMPIQMV